VFLYAYGPTLLGLARRWGTNPQYSHGYLVPMFAVALLWMRRAELKDGVGQGSWWGLAVLGCGVALHLAGTYLYYDWLAEVSLLPTLAGLCLCLGGVKTFRWAWPAILYLAFMLPLPHRLEVALAFPLQRLATLTSSYLLQTLGFSAVAEGNIIVMENARLGIVEACNGLGMLVTFFALATAVAMVIKRPWLDRGLVILSAVPIAVVANVIRITATGVLAETVGQQWADLVFHDLAGWLMMPLALALLGLELLILSWVLVEAAPQETGVAMHLAGPTVRPGARRARPAKKVKLA
jgi:exosortase